jgi:predicted secreted protein
MSESLKDILSHLSADIDQETLLLYLQDKLSAEKKHEVEKKLLENEFANDAAEGLQQFKNKERVSLLVEQLNRELKNKLKTRKKIQRIHLKEQPWLYLAVIIIIILIVISYFVIHRLLQHR